MTDLRQAIEYFKASYPLVKIVDFDDDSKLVYDGRANMMFTISNADLPVVADYLQGTDLAALAGYYSDVDGIEKIVERIDELREKGVLLPGGMERLISTEPDDVRARVRYNMENILMRKFVLETTQQCNFRCRYCPNTLETVYRHHTGRQMSLEVAEASIDFYKEMYLKFYRRLPDDKKALLLEHFHPSVGFYGGEPSLNWQLVEQATDYFMNLDWDKDGIPRDKLQTSVNTNLYNLTDEMMSYIKRYRPLLFVSLDGPREEHDRNRVTADGKGTFDRVYANLMRLKEADAEFFVNKVLILCVEADGNDINAVHEWLDKIGCPIEYLNEQPFDCLERNPLEQISAYDENEQEFISNTIARYKTAVAQGREDALSELSSLYFLDSTERDTPQRRRRLSVSLTCPLCVDNIMVDVDGDMHICHKTDGSLPLGNVLRGGYDIEKMEEAYRSYGEATNCEACRNCWAVNECKYCAATRLHGGRWKNPLPDECALQRRSVEYLLKLFVAVYKEDPGILQRLMQHKHDLNHYKSIVDFNEFIRL